MAAVKVPYNQLSPEALHGVIEEFVTRDGTDYGEVEVPLETKISQVLGQLKSKKAVYSAQQNWDTLAHLNWYTAEFTGKIENNLTKAWNFTIKDS